MKFYIFGRYTEFPFFLVQFWINFFLWNDCTEFRVVYLRISSISYKFWDEHEWKGSTSAKYFPVLIFHPNLMHFFFLANARLLWISFESIQKISNFFMEKMLNGTKILKFDIFGRYMYIQLISLSNFDKFDVFSFEMMNNYVNYIPYNLPCLCFLIRFDLGISFGFQN